MDGQAYERDDTQTSGDASDGGASGAGEAGPPASSNGYGPLPSRRRAHLDPSYQPPPPSYAPSQWGQPYESGSSRSSSRADDTGERFSYLEPTRRPAPAAQPSQPSPPYEPTPPSYEPPPPAYEPPKPFAYEMPTYDRPSTASASAPSYPVPTSAPSYPVPTSAPPYSGPTSAPPYSGPASPPGSPVGVPSPTDRRWNDGWDDRLPAVREPRTRESSRELEPVPRRFARLDDPPHDDERSGRRQDGDGRRSMPLWQELPLLLVVAFCLAVLIRTFLLQAFYIPSGSMEDTLLVGDRVLVNKIVYDVRQPERGEVIVFRGPDNWVPENTVEPAGSLLGRIGRTLGDLVGVSRPGEKDFIKRVIGLPGDRVSCCDTQGRVFVNGIPIDEPYVLRNSPLDVTPDARVCRSRAFDEVLVPPGQLFVMGDHRIVSQDSRCQGTVPIEDVIGRAFVIVWPSDRWDTLGVPDTFANVPGPVAMGPPGVGPVGFASIGAAAVTFPILASLVATARRGRKRRWGRRTLRA